MKSSLERKMFITVFFLFNAKVSVVVYSVWVVMDHIIIVIHQKKTF